MKGESPNPGPNPDPKGVEIAREVHGRRGPLATILFGSRARGDHRDDSDVDVMMVEQEQPPAHEWEKDADEESQRIRAKSGMELHMVCIDLATIQREAVLINSFCSRVLLDGVVISEQPELFRSPYAGRDGLEPKYDWTQYQWWLRACRNNLRIVQVANALEEGDRKTAESITIEPPWNYMVSRSQPDWESARQAAVRSMHAALGAAVTATGGWTRDEDLAPELAARLEKLIPGETMSTRIPLESYGRGEPPAGMSDRNFTRTALEDVEMMRKLAGRLRRRTTGKPKTGQGK